MLQALLLALLQLRAPLQLPGLPPSRCGQPTLGAPRSVVQFKEVFLTPEYLAIAMEYAAGGDMFQYVKQRGGLEEAEARWFFQQLIIGMDYCHKMVRAPSCLPYAGLERQRQALHLEECCVQRCMDSRALHPACACGACKRVSPQAHVPCKVGWFSKPRCCFVLEKHDVAMDRAW